MSFTGDYSAAEEEARIVPPPGVTFLLRRMIVIVRGSGLFRAENYGSLPGPLPSGIGLELRSSPDDEPVTRSMVTDVVTIKHSAGWAALAGVDVDLKEWGAGDKFLVARFTFGWASGYPLRVRGDSGEYFAVVLNDSFLGLNDHTFMVHGVRV